MKNQLDRENRIYEYIVSESRKNGFPPTVREICQALDIKSTSTVQKAMDSLVERGLIEKKKNQRRAIIINSQDTVSEPEKAYTAPAPAETERADILDIPVIGRVAAGTPILAEQNIEDSFPVPTRFLGKGKNFMLTVHGESMIEAGIFDGDYILVEQCNDARNGDTVVAMIDGIESGATVKTFYKEDGHIRLQPENSSMSPIIVENCTILGKVKGVFRYFDRKH